MHFPKAPVDSPLRGEEATPLVKVTHALWRRGWEWAQVWGGASLGDVSDGLCPFLPSPGLEVSECWTCRTILGRCGERMAMMRQQSETGGWVSSVSLLWVKGQRTCVFHWGPAITRSIGIQEGVLETSQLGTVVQAPSCSMGPKTTHQLLGLAALQFILHCQRTQRPFLKTYMSLL